MIDGLGNTRVVLAHDWLVGLRGGERVLDRLAARFGPTRLYTLVNDGRPLTDAIGRCEVVTSFLQRLPAASGSARRAYLPLMPMAVDRLKVEPCDLVISTSSAVMKSLRPPPGARHLCYCHSPARYVWEQADDYALGAGGRLRRLGLGAVRRRFQRWDRATADRVSRFVANSRHTAARIERCYGRRAEVVHPPARTRFFTPDPAVPREDWLLVVSALEPYKRTDLVIAAAGRGGWPLKVVGTGSQLQALRRAAGPSIELLGHVDDLALRELYRRARALVFPQLEDFGITAVEAQATGCPVVAFRAGGAVDTVSEATGEFFDTQTAAALDEAVQRLARRAPIDPCACRASAERFSETRFDEAMVRQAREVLAE